MNLYAIMEKPTGKLLTYSYYIVESSYPYGSECVYDLSIDPEDPVWFVDDKALADAVVTKSNKKTGGFRCPNMYIDSDDVKVVAVRVVVDT